MDRAKVFIISYECMSSGTLTPASPPPPSFSTNPSPMLYNMDELLRMKRKEKHMAPIDCSGVRNFVKIIQDTSQ